MVDPFTTADGRSSQPAFRIGCLVSIREGMVRETFAALARHGLPKNWSFLWWPDRHIAEIALAQNPVDVLISNGDHSPSWSAQAKWTIRLGIMGPEADFNITTDHRSLATTCYKHVRFRGIHAVGLWGFEGGPQNGATLRRLQLETLAREDSIPFSYAPADTPKDFKGTVNKLAHWIKAQPLPLGIFVNRIEHAHMMLQACHQAQVSVPQQVRLIALTDDEPLSELSSPTISTGIIHHRGQGAVVAKLLDQLAINQPPTWRHQIIQPLGAMPRGSTDYLMCGDSDIDHVIAQLPSHSLNADSIAERIGISARQVQRRFKRQRGITLQAVMTQLKMEQAIRHLLHSNSPIAEIGKKLGYQNAQSFSHCFKRFTGSSPQKWLNDARKYDK